MAARHIKPERIVAHICEEKIILKTKSEMRFFGSFFVYYEEIKRELKRILMSVGVMRD
jgi:hypothetical protein